MNVIRLRLRVQPLFMQKTRFILTRWTKIRYYIKLGILCHIVQKITRNRLAA